HNQTMPFWSVPLNLIYSKYQVISERAYPSSGLGADLPVFIMSSLYPRLPKYESNITYQVAPGIYQLNRSLAGNSAPGKSYTVLPSLDFFQKEPFYATAYPNSS